MGVHQLWSLLEPVGRRVNIEALRNKKLAVGKAHAPGRACDMDRYPPSITVPMGWRLGSGAHCANSWFIVWHKALFVNSWSQQELKASCMRPENVLCESYLPQFQNSPV